MDAQQKADDLAHTQAMITLLRGLLQGLPQFQQASMESRQYIGWTPSMLRKELKYYTDRLEKLTGTAKNRMKRVLLTP